MKLRRELLLFSMVSVVFLAGCASGPAASSSAGVIITSFAPDVQTIDGGSSVTFLLNVKNTGERTASTVKALLFGLSNEWDGIPSTSNIDPIPTDPKIISSTLAPADPATGLPGEEGSTDWTFTAPAGKNSDVTYDASVRVFYDYTLESNTLLRFVKSEYLKTNPNVQKGIISSSSTGGPLLITAVARTPTISGTGTVGRVQFEIQNVGNGRVINSEINGQFPSTALDIIGKITVSGLGTSGKCSGIGTGGTAGLTDTRLAGGKSKVISCDIDVSGITNFADRDIKVVIAYKYFTDSATQITVLKSLTEGSTPASSGTTVVENVCVGKNAGDPCTVNDAGRSYDGKCILVPIPGRNVFTCVEG